VGLFSDQRKAVRMDWNNQWSRAGESHSWSVGTSLNLRWRPSGRADLSVGPFFNSAVNGLQWVERVGGDEDHFVFGRIEQETLGATGRMDLTFTPDLTLQLYLQPFVSAGRYTDFKQVADPRAQAFSHRFRRLTYERNGEDYRSDLDGDGTEEVFRDPDFNIQQFRSNLVLRWEFRPGSLMYLVWSQGRDHFTKDGRFDLDRNLSDLFRQEAENVFMLKVSYWITP
jgi:hypothetical protein